MNVLPPGSVDLGGENPLDDGGGPVVAEEVAAEPEEEPDKPRGRKRARTAEEEPANFMEGQAKEDVGRAKAKHIDDGLDSVAEMVDRMRKGVAYAKAVHDVEVKLAVLSEVADTAASVRDDARRAVRNATAEKRNLQT